MEKGKAIKEGSCWKGGRNIKAPKTPRPKTSPPGQNLKKEKLSDNDQKK